MRDLLLIACGSGLRDGLNPCVFMACAFFITPGRWLNSGWGFIAWLRIFFVLIYAIGSFVFNFGYGPVVVLQKNFILTGRVIYFLLGLGSFLLGLYFLKSWNRVRQGSPAEVPPGKRVKFLSFTGFSVCLATVALSAVLSALATLWPMNKYIIVLGNESLLRGQWQSAMPMLLSYILFSMWPLWILWSFISIKNLKASLLNIVYSSVFFTASSCMIFLFK